jgi:hypothetical protein
MYNISSHIYIYFKKRRLGGPFKKSYYLISHLGLVILKNEETTAGRPGGRIFVFAHVEALTNLAKQGWQGGG